MHQRNWKHPESPIIKLHLLSATFPWIRGVRLFERAMDALSLAQDPIPQVPANLASAGCAEARLRDAALSGKPIVLDSVHSENENPREVTFPGV